MSSLSGAKFCHAMELAVSETLSHHEPWRSITVPPRQGWGISRAVAKTSSLSGAKSCHTMDPGMTEPLCHAMSPGMV